MIREKYLLQMPISNYVLNLIFVTSTLQRFASVGFIVYPIPLYHALGVRAARRGEQRLLLLAQSVHCHCLIAFPISQRVYLELGTAISIKLYLNDV